MELLLFIIPIYVLISLVAFFKWLQLSVLNSNLEISARQQKKDYEELNLKYEKLKQRFDREVIRDK